MVARATVAWSAPSLARCSARMRLCPGRGASRRTGTIARCPRSCRAGDRGGEVTLRTGCGGLGAVSGIRRVVGEPVLQPVGSSARAPGRQSVDAEHKHPQRSDLLPTTGPPGSMQTTLALEPRSSRRARSAVTHGPPCAGKSRTERHSLDIPLDTDAFRAPERPSPKHRKGASELGFFDRGGGPICALAATLVLP